MMMIGEKKKNKNENRIKDKHKNNLSDKDLRIFGCLVTFCAMLKLKID